MIYIVAFVALTVLALLMRSNLRTPSRRYEGPASVAGVYDQWTTDQMMEPYWGEHLHAGYYGKPPVKKDFITAKVDFIDEMIQWGIAMPNPKLNERLEKEASAELVKILDVGCGIGGSTRHMARRWPKTAHVTGITLSKAQVERANVFTQTQEIENALFIECDALKMEFPDASFDIVWAVESEMHMPDKDYFIREMVRVLKPGGMLVIAAWNVRDTRGAPLSKAEADHVRLLVDEWAHAKFISIHEYLELFEKNNLLAVTAEDWTVPTQPSWRQAVWEAVRNPRAIMNISMRQRWSLVRDAYTIFQYDAAFQTGLCQYGLIRGKKAG